MTTRQVAAMVASIGIPYAYYQFPEGTEQATPFICFFYPENNDIIADNSNYQKVERLAIELYTDNKDFELEAEVEAALAENGLVWSRAEEWIAEERMLEVVYEMDVIITSEED